MKKSILLSVVFLGSHSLVVASELGAPSETEDRQKKVIAGEARLFNEENVSLEQLAEKFSESNEPCAAAHKNQESASDGEEDKGVVSIEVDPSNPEATLRQIKEALGVEGAASEEQIEPGLVRSLSNSVLSTLAVTSVLGESTEEQLDEKIKNVTEQEGLRKRTIEKSEDKKSKKAENLSKKEECGAERNPCKKFWIWTVSWFSSALN